MAFGLATYLAAARWTRPRTRRALALFAAASPIAAVATFALLAAAPALSSPAGIALCVLFSGGTFLYASCIHILVRPLRSAIWPVQGTSESIARIHLSVMQGAHTQQLCVLAISLPFRFPRTSCCMLSQVSAHPQHTPVLFEPAYDKNDSPGPNPATLLLRQPEVMAHSASMTLQQVAAVSVGTLVPLLVSALQARPRPADGC